ncbi:DNA-binding response regulator [Paenibacillus sp. 598K]|uniref:response regulator n=1 Tax=Paenibacillus sp. 598K TaxID=1117987 RepID=UPI000FF8FF89|nr:response regulator [Paenibacillus sp. 598K]GBF75367.1 DNA-binding response regulator [Paenibacillus sp. 598K]
MLNLLLVDDEAYVIDDLEIAFPWDHYGIEQVYKAYSGPQAIKMLEAHRIDLVMTDIAMPVMTGLELIRQIRQTKPELACILLTGFAEFEYAKEAIEQGVVEYLIKPLDHKKLAACLEKTTGVLREQRQQADAYQQALSSFREHLPALQDKLLNELLDGRAYASESLQEKLEEYRLHIREGDTFSLLLVRLEERFNRYGEHSLTLFEYAVTNIASELFGDQFEVWHAKESQGYLVFVLQLSPGQRDLSKAELTDELSRRSRQLHANVNEYLKGGISAVLTTPGQFRRDLVSMHDSAVAALRSQVGEGSGFFLSLADLPKKVRFQSLSALYEPPTFNQLLESGRWEEFDERLKRLATEYETLQGATVEHLDEIQSVLMAAFHYVAHTNRVLLTELVGEDLSHKMLFRSLTQLLQWASRIANTLRDKLETRSVSQQEALLHTIEAYIDEQLSAISLQAIADHVRLHPVYVSKLFKQLKGMSISDYILRVRMDQATYLLKHTSDKIYAIAEKVGYSNSQYFIKVFRDQFGKTPQEYRDQS